MTLETRPNARRPVPKLERDTHGYWEHLRRHELVIQRCAQCRTYRHHPRPMCPECHALDFEWAPLYGKISLLAEGFAHFNLYLIAGPAASQY